MIEDAGFKVVTYTNLSGGIVAIHSAHINFHNVNHCFLMNADPIKEMLALYLPHSALGSFPVPF